MAKPILLRAAQPYLQMSNHASGAVFTTLHFLANGPRKLECYITLGWKGLLQTNTLAYCLIQKSKWK
jgi:hypothetical protein